jgi:[ribosomal protein S18]-alanine N-acetyltransferase
MTLDTERQAAVLQAMRADDLQAVVAVEQTAYSHPWTQGHFRDALASGYWAQCLRLQDELLGYVVAMEGVQEAHLLNITVTPKRQGQGWAHMMLDALCLWARRQGAEWLWLEVRESNQRALQVYARYGFHRVGLRKDYYPADRQQREHAVVMSLNLKLQP